MNTKQIDEYRCVEGCATFKTKTVGYSGSFAAQQQTQQSNAM